MPALDRVIREVESAAETVGRTAGRANLDGAFDHAGHTFGRDGRDITIDGRSFRMSTTGHARAMFRRLNVAALED